MADALLTAIDKALLKTSGLADLQLKHSDDRLLNYGTHRLPDGVLERAEALRAEAERLQHESEAERHRITALVNQLRGLQAQQRDAAQLVSNVRSFVDSLPGEIEEQARWIGAEWLRANPANRIAGLQNLAMLESSHKHRKTILAGAEAVLVGVTEQLATLVSQHRDELESMGLLSDTTTTENAS